jgi:tripeptide aminopeptidase
LVANDKTGIAAISTTLEILKENPDIPHGETKLAFTPDEETGHGVDHFDMEKFSADFAYTVERPATRPATRNTMFIFHLSRV